MVVRRRDVLVPISRNAYEVYLLTLCALSGLLALFGATRNAPVAPPALVLIWSGLILLGGGLGVLGALLRDVISGLLVSRVGALFMGPAALAYGAVLIGIDRTFLGLVTGVIVVGLGVASLVRAAQVTSHLHTAIRLRVEAEEAARADVADLAGGAGGPGDSPGRGRRYLGAADDAGDEGEDRGGG